MRIKLIFVEFRFLPRVSEIVSLAVFFFFYCCFVLLLGLVCVDESYDIFCTYVAVFGCHLRIV